MSAAKSFTIPKHVFMDAFKAVRANRGGAGVDGQSIDDFGKDLEDNLYKLWNRMSSGTYFPPPVKAVAIPKKNGGERILGVPTVADRVAQMVVKKTLEPLIESVFHQDSYGYRPGKSALDAIKVTRERCWRYDWLFEWDIKGLFDNIPHDLLLKAVRKHTDIAWVLLYVERWLTAPMQKVDGSLVARTKGTPQGGVISPCLSNLFLHYAFDLWMGREFPHLPWCRYADDGLIHCRTELEAQQLREALTKRLAECGLSIHPDKSKIVYCKDSKRRGSHPTTKFDFLGYNFRPRYVINNATNHRFVGFTPAVSPSSLKSMMKAIRRSGMRNRSDLSIEEISQRFDPVLRGWFEYYGKFHSSSLNPVWRHFNETLVAWATNKYRKLRGRKTRASLMLKGIAKRQPDLFTHWRNGKVISFA